MYEYAMGEWICIALCMWMCVVLPAVSLNARKDGEKRNNCIRQQNVNILLFDLHTFKRKIVWHAMVEIVLGNDWVRCVFVDG